MCVCVCGGDVTHFSQSGHKVGGDPHLDGEPEPPGGCHGLRVQEEEELWMDVGPAQAGPFVPAAQDGGGDVVFQGSRIVVQVGQRHVHPLPCHLSLERQHHFLQRGSWQGRQR